MKILDITAFICYSSVRVKFPAICAGFFGNEGQLSKRGHFSNESRKVPSLRLK